VDVCRNLLAKIPTGLEAEVKDAYWKICDERRLGKLDINAPTTG
jgi:hypothetical protein